MTIQHTHLAQLNGKLCLTDGGMETDLIFNKQIPLPLFASYDLLRSEEGYSILYDYYKDYARLALNFNSGLILETPTWRANADWGRKLGDTAEDLHRFNLSAVKLVAKIKQEYASENTPIVISACIGPRGDGYKADFRMSVAEARKYHSAQIASFAKTKTDMVSALTMNYIEEAIGIALAAKEKGLPLCISFTVETNGKLPSGESLAQAIKAVDEASDNYPVYYMINCAHPTHFVDILDDEYCISRLRGIRANASRCSHAELDEAEKLDDGNPQELGRQFAEIRSRHPHLNVVGGCCGTDYRHIEQIAACCS
jgi:S-methylmethionine-dependent homocysteine/selenocysteine methylase